MLTLTDILIHHVERFPDRTALEFEGRTTTWRGLLEATCRSAGGLRDIGIGPGAVVAVLLRNSDRFLEIMHAISHLGAIFMPLNFRLASPELAYILEHAGANALITEQEFVEVVGRIETVAGRKILLGDGAGTAWESFDQLADRATPQEEPSPVSADDIHRLMYTSGTTARPKGVMITYGNLYAKNVSHLVEFSVVPQDVNFVCGPLYHVGALDLTTTTMMYVGAASHIRRHFDPAQVIDAIDRCQATHVWMAPAMIKAIVDAAEAHNRTLESVRLLVDGGEKMPLPLIDRVLAVFPNAWFADAYGLTETVSGDTFLDKGRVRDKLGSVGKPVIHTQIRIVDGQGRSLGPGEEGEIVIRGPKVSKGYWRDEEATARAMREGWFHTGDLGVLDEDNYLFVVDRVKDIIVSGGENVASSEIERVLYEHERVIEAAVVGRPDARWGEVPVAYVVLAEAVDEVITEELERHCSERLARFKTPKEFYVIDALPRNPSGKILKRELRDWKESSRRLTGAE